MKLKTTLAVMLALGAASASAQTANVTLYGAIDAALVYIDNVGGKSLTKVDTAGQWAGRWGLRGSEDLGGGLAAIFTLESGFDTDTGALGQGGLLFGRQAFVGLRSSSLGTFTIGRQYDFAYQLVPPPIVMVIGGLAGAAEGAGVGNDMHLGGTRYNNSGKWVGAFGPVQVGAMYGLGSENKVDKMYSFGASYRAGPINTGIAYIRDNFSAPSAGNKVVFASMHYDVTPEIKLILGAGRSQADVASDRVSRTSTVEGGLLYKVTAPLSLGIVAAQGNIRTVANASGRINQIGFGALYDFSKRSQLYGLYSHVHNGGAAGNGFSGVPGIGLFPTPANRSTTANQNVLKLGIRHLF